MKKLILVFLFILPMSVWAQDAATATEAEATTTTESADESTSEEAAATDEAEQKTNFPALAGTVSKKVTCKLNNDEREISIVQDPEGPSSVVYKKNGEEKTVAYAQNDGSYVERVAEKIQTNLEAASFTCENAE